MLEGLAQARDGNSSNQLRHASIVTSNPLTSCQCVKKRLHKSSHLSYEG